MRVPGQSPGIQSFLAGATDVSKVGNSAQVNAAKEHAQSFDNNRVVGGAVAKNMAANINTGREIEAMEAESSAQIQSNWAQTGASALGSVASVFGSSGGGGGYSSGGLSFSKEAGAQAQSEFGSFVRSQ